MRTFASLLATLALTACDPTPVADPGAGPDDPPIDVPPADEPPPDEPPTTHELTLPAKYVAAHEAFLYAEIDGDHAVAETELIYALADNYPSRITLTAEGGYLLASECSSDPGPVVWRSISDIKGDAATLELIDGAVTIDLRAEGNVSFLLTGDITEQTCTLADVPVTSVPLQHRVTLAVHRPAGFAIETFHQLLKDCPDTVVLPAGVPLWAPVARPLDARFKPFAAQNAPAPIAITLRSDGHITADAESVYLTAEPGSVELSFATTLPVRGLQAFTVIGPAALSSVDATLYLQKSAAKGTVLEPITDGSSYSLFFPDQPNTVDIRVHTADTTHGDLCAHIPATWFTSASATPEQCTATAGDPDETEATDLIQLATIRSPGECRLEVSIPGTEFTWSTNFTTTP